MTALSQARGVTVLGVGKGPVGVMRDYSVYLVVIVSVSLAAWANSASSGLSLDECIRLAENAPSEVTAARKRMEAAEYGIRRTTASFLPQVHFLNGFTYNSPLRGIDPSQHSFLSLDGVRRYNSFLSTTLDLDLSGRLRAERARARADQEIAAAEVRIAGRDLRWNVADAYYQLLLTRHLVEVAEATLVEARSFEDRTRLLVEQGEVARADLVRASAETAFRNQAVENARLSEQLANHQLASFWTRNVDLPVMLQDVLEHAPVPPGAVQGPASVVKEDLFLRRPEFAWLDAQSRGFMSDARRARADLFPQATLNYQYGLDSESWSMRDRGYALFVNLDIPLVDWFRARNASRQFKLQAGQIAEQRALAERNFSKEYRDALTRVERLFEQIAQAETQVQLSEESLRLSRLRYTGGEGSALDVLSAQSRWSEARSNYYVTLAGYWNALADLEVAEGR